MTYHNPTCGCAECGNYGQVFNPLAIHNQSCGCAVCQNYPKAMPVAKSVRSSAQHIEMIEVPVELAAEVRALIAQRKKS
jgi:hypothetical protein